MSGSGPTYEIDVHLLTLQSREPGNPHRRVPAARGRAKALNLIVALRQFEVRSANRSNRTADPKSELPNIFYESDRF